MARLVLRKAVLMVGALAVFFGIVWMLQSTGKFTDDQMISSDPRLFGPGIAMVVGGIVAILVARKI